MSQDYNEFMRHLSPLLISRQNNMMLEFSFWMTSPPKVTNNIYELRKYVLKVSFIHLPSLLISHQILARKIIRMGNELVSFSRFIFIFSHATFRRKGLDCRRKFCEPVGAWFTQLGELNTVYHMWTYP